MAECNGDSNKILHAPPDPDCAPHPGGMGVLFMEKLKEHKHKIGQIDAETGRTETNGEILLRSIRVAQEMKARGVTSDDIVTICSYNTMDSALPMLASLFLGIRIASLDPTLPLSDTIYLLKLVNPRYIFCGVESVDLIATAIKEANLSGEIVVLGETKEHVPLLEFLVSSGKEDEFEAKPVNDLHDTAIIFFSSGTTGLPKGICATHYGLISQQYYSLYGNDLKVVLYFTTFYWISAVMLFTMSILTGGARLICKKFDENTALKIIQDYKVSYSFMAPTYTYKLTKKYKADDFDTTHLKTVCIGGGRVGDDQMKLLRELLPHTCVMLCYGMTEACGCVTLFNPWTDRDMMESNSTSSGRPIPGISYKIVNPETDEVLGPNQSGEIRLKGECLMNGYHNNPEETKNVWDAEGYLHTGDVGYYNEDLCFYIVDRIKDMMKFQSWHVVPAELESILLTHPDVKEAAVIGLPHEIDGEHPTGVIVLKPGATATEQDILSYYEGAISGSERKQLRGGVRFVDHIPQTPTGKLRRRDLRAFILNGP